MRARALLVLLVTLVAVLAADVAVLATHTAVHRAGAVTAVTTRSSNGYVSTSSQSYVNVPEAWLQVAVPTGQTAVFLVTFDAASTCIDYDEGPNTYCKVRFVVDDLDPDQAAYWVTFDTAEVTNGGWHTAGASYTTPVLGPGTHRLQMQWGVDETTALFSLYNWNLTALRARVS